MRMQKFTAATNQLAMQQVLQKLGAEALIYSTRRKGSGVEIIAGMPGSVESPFSDLEPTEAMSERLLSIEKNLQMIASRINVDFSEETTRNQLYYYLSQMGLKGQFRNGFVERYFIDVPTVGAIDPSRVDEHISQAIKVDEYEPIDVKNICMLVGPTGVGKTTTIVKMAKRYINRYDADSLGIIMLDSDEIASKNLLTTYSDILGVDLLRAESIAELKTAVDRFADKSFILIDTSGINQNDWKKIQELNHFQDDHRGEISFYLTMACNIQEEILDDIASAFKTLDLSGCILTKLDESLSISSAVNTCLNHDFSLSYLCDGQNVYNDISPARIDSIMASMFSGPRMKTPAREKRESREMTV